MIAELAQYSSGRTAGETMARTVSGTVKAAYDVKTGAGQGENLRVVRAAGWG